MNWHVPDWLCRQPNTESDWKLIVSFCVSVKIMHPFLLPLGIVNSINHSSGAQYRHSIAFFGLLSVEKISKGHLKNQYGKITSIKLFSVMYSPAIYAKSLKSCCFYTNNCLNKRWRIGCMTYIRYHQKEFHIPSHISVLLGQNFTLTQRHTDGMRIL